MPEFIVTYHFDNDHAVSHALSQDSIETARDLVAGNLRKPGPGLEESELLFVASGDGTEYIIVKSKVRCCSVRARQDRADAEPETGNPQRDPPRLHRSRHARR